MTLTDIKGDLLARLHNLQSQHIERQRDVALSEADLVRTRAAANAAFGAVQATEQAIGVVDKAIAAEAAPKS